MSNSSANLSSPVVSPAASPAASPARTVTYASPASTPASLHSETTETDHEEYPDEEAQRIEDESQESSTKDDDIRLVRQLEQDGKLGDTVLTLFEEFRDLKASTDQCRQLLIQLQRITQNVERQLEFMENSQNHVDDLLQKMRAKKKQTTDQMEEE